MVLVGVIDILVIAVIVGLTVSKDLERTLPFVAFLLTLMPRDSTIPLPGLFELTTHRVILVTLGLLYVFFRNSGAGGHADFSTPLKYLILAHITWSLLSTMNSVVFVLSLRKMLAQVCEYYLLYYIFARTITNVATVRRILFGIVSAMILCSVFGFIEAYFHWSVLTLFPQTTFGEYGPLDVDMARGLRVRATFVHPILFGGALSLAIPLALYLLTVVEKAGQRIFLVVGLMLMFLSLYKTSSRGPWIATAFSLILLVPFSELKIRRYLLAFGTMVAVVLLLRPGVRSTIVSFYQQTFQPDTVLGGSYSYRFALLNVSVQALAANPGRLLWGYGYESFRSLHLQGEFRGDPTHTFLSCDNAWVELMVETGCVGLMIIAALLFTPALLTLKYFRHARESERYLSGVLFVAMCAYYVEMISVAMYSWGQNGYMLWTLIAASLAYSRVAELQSSDQEAQGSASWGGAIDWRGGSSWVPVPPNR